MSHHYPYPVKNYAENNRPAVHSLLEEYKEKQSIIFKSREEIGEWLAQIVLRFC